VGGVSDADTNDASFMLRDFPVKSGLSIGVGDASHNQILVRVDMIAETLVTARGGE